MPSLKGKIVNFDETFNGEVIFNDKINKIIRSKFTLGEDYIIPGFIDLHCHGANGFDTMDGWNSINGEGLQHVNCAHSQLFSPPEDALFLLIKLS